MIRTYGLHWASDKVFGGLLGRVEPESCSDPDSLEVQGIALISANSEVFTLSMPILSWSISAKPELVKIDCFGA